MYELRKVRMMRERKKQTKKGRNKADKGRKVEGLELIYNKYLKK